MYINGIPSCIPEMNNRNFQGWGGGGESTYTETKNKQERQEILRYKSNKTHTGPVH